LASTNRMLALSPRDAETLNLRGLVLRDLERPEEAVASYELALSGRSDLSEAWHNRGVALADLKRFDEALRSLASLVRSRPSFCFKCGATTSLSLAKARYPVSSG